MEREKGQAVILGAILIAFLIIASIAIYMFLSNQMGAYINTVNKGLDKKGMKLNEKLRVYGEQEEKILEIKNIGGETSHITALALLNNDTGGIQFYNCDYTVHPMETIHIGFSEMQGYPPYIAGVVTDLGNIFWDDAVTGALYVENAEYSVLKIVSRDVVEQTYTTIGSHILIQLNNIMIPSIPSGAKVSGVFIYVDTSMSSVVTGGSNTPFTVTNKMMFQIYNGSNWITRDLYTVLAHHQSYAVFSSINVFTDQGSSSAKTLVAEVSDLFQPGDMIPGIRINLNISSSYNYFTTVATSSLITIQVFYYYS